MSLGQPVLDPQTRHTGELIHIRRHDRQAQRESLRGDQQIIRANGGALSGQLLPDLSVVPVGGLLKRQDIHC